MNISVRPSSALRSLSRFITWARTLTSSAAVGSSAMRKSGLVRQRPRDADPLELAAAELVRVAVGEVRVEADQLQQLAGCAAAASAAVADAVHQHRLADDVDQTVKRRFTDEYGFWNTICIRRRI